ncbi:alpha/beta fold hydrolase [Stenotrophobium rhamnosiphilum]|uniref:AB hydrolase-1 domain-containing protein n=1 Tax=Stenotrophobium rhamnosiphilum TaxID=2029166 RepID=A0A2T5ME91_9GAMM|nr:alpha/beta hydrolase [Stenotrophobium rhamnosiphilum]PTU30901.1 hypothetical protein CJD38_11355 [Stenotrophobium rhamnosiphilum]
MLTVETTLPFPEVYEGGSGEIMVLVHGFTETWRVWIPILKLLEPHYRIIAPTLPGHIGGLPINEPGSPKAIFDLLEKQLRERGITQAHFVGQSLGGWAALEMARRGIARSAMGLSPAGGFRDGQVTVEFKKKSRLILKVLPYVIPLVLFAARFPRLRKMILAGDMQNGDRAPYAVVKDRLTRVKKMTIIEEFLDADLSPMKPLPADNKVPLRVVWCEKDTTLRFDECGQPLLDALGLKTHGVLKGCGHNPMFDDPEAVAKEILDFARSVERDEKK